MNRGLLVLPRRPALTATGPRWPQRSEATPRTTPAGDRVRPPGRLGFATVIAEQIRKEVGASALASPETSQQRPRTSACRRPAPRPARRPRPAADARESPSETAARLRLALEQPVPQLQRRVAVLLVVPLDGLQDRVVAGFQPPRELDDRFPASGHRAFTGVRHEKRPNLLQRISVVRHPHRLSHDAKEVDEHLPPEEIVKLLFARAVTLHQLLELRRLVARVVIDMKMGWRARQWRTTSMKSSNIRFSA